MKDAISPKELAEAIGVSESSVKRWVDQGLLGAARTAGGHRRIAREDALRWLRETQTPVVRPDRIGLPETTVLVDRATPLPAAAERFFDALSEGKEHDAQGILAGLCLAGHTAASIADDVVRPAMTRIGTLWEHSDDGIFIEHRATAICMDAVRDLRGMLPDHAGRAPIANLPVAVGGAPTGDPYLVAPMLAALTLTEVGFHSVNLGPKTPIRVLELAAQRLSASLVFLSIGAPMPDSVAREIHSLGERLGALNVQLVLGGRHADGCQPNRIPGVFVGRGLVELAAFARGLVRRAPRVE